MLSRQGYAVQDRRDIARVHRELTVAPETKGGKKPVRRFTVFWEVDGVTYVPRFWGAAALGVPRQAAEFDVHADITARFAGALRPEQTPAAEATLASLRARGGAVLSLFVGGGKTTIACWVASRLCAKTVVVVHKDVLRKQWAERVAQFLPGARVTFVQGATCDASGDVVIVMLQTLCARPEYAAQLQDAGLVVVDECHHVAAEVFGTAMRGLCAPYTLGLSATPERKDGLGRVVRWFLGPTAFESPRTGMGNVSVRMVRYDCPGYRVPPPASRYGGGVDYAAAMSLLTGDLRRTRRIAELVQELRDAGAQAVLVLSHRRDHCAALAALIPGAVAFVGGSKTDELAKTAAVVCATYALASEGYDDPRLDALVLATPSSDVVQATGRVLRGAAAPRIVDLVDEWGMCWSQSQKRRAYYVKAGFRIESVANKTTPLGTGKCLIID